MPLGILESREPEVPGTVYILDHANASDNIQLDPNLKHDTSGKVTRILVPQPSDDPNDPLNWSIWKRDRILFIISLQAVIAASLSPLLAADTVSLSLYYGRGYTFTKVALLTGYHLLGVGIGGVLFVPSSRIWGKRHAFLLGNLIVIISSAWGGGSGKNYKSALAARIFQGIGLAPFEALVNATVGDLYFVHERGKRMALTNFCVFGGSFMTPIIVGKMASTLGWPWTFYFVAIFSAAMFPLLFFFVPEMAYRRDDRLNTDMGLIVLGTNQLATSTTTPAGVLDSHDQHTSPSESFAEKPTSAPAAHLQAQSFKSSLSPFNGRKTDEAFWKLFLRPFPLFLHPTIFWAVLIQGTLIGWTVFLGIVLAAIMLGPPLFFNEVKTGYMYTGAFIGAIIGFLIAGLLSDSIPNYLTRRNGGRYEPEFRLWLVLPQLILGCAGLYGFGITSDNTYKYGWFWPDFFFALEVAGMVVGAVASSLYVVDAHRGIAIEAFTCMMVFKNVFSFGLTFSGYDWLAATGIKPIFIAIASVQVGVCLLTIPLYIFGKRNRAFLAKHDILKAIGLS
ncbi:MFS transporter [Microthyrium microscopicum]|uniref:MFS transporter n=1 Tax=Microthyrium microscopicum TaxID=703497 RepID=A0A6A6UJ56_9PEZI|nr:MFS transporter [Microthyrium microscopicum]